MWLKICGCIEIMCVMVDVNMVVEFCVDEKVVKGRKKVLSKGVYLEKISSICFVFNIVFMSFCVYSDYSSNVGGYDSVLNVEIFSILRII